MQEVVPLESPVFVVFGDGAEVLLVQRDFNPFVLYLAEGVLHVLRLPVLRLYFESVAEHVFLVLEEVLQNHVLVLLQDPVLALYES